MVLFRFVSVMAMSVVMSLPSCEKTMTKITGVEVVEKTEYHTPPTIDDGLEDDQLADKTNEFDPELFDRRSLEDWQINQSEAVIRLDIPLAKPDHDAELLKLHASYIDAVNTAKAQRGHLTVLPSVNMIDGKAKQFDDGLYAAIDQAYFRGVAEQLPGHLDVFERLLSKLDPSSQSAAYIAAGLTLGGRETVVDDPEVAKSRDRMVNEFRANGALSKPISFYNWTEDLQNCWAFLRFFQRPPPRETPIAAELVAALTEDSTLAVDLQNAAMFFGKLTNPLEYHTLVDLIGKELPANGTVTAAFFPSSTSRENELYRRLFPNGLPDDANLMKELILAIRSGTVDLSPRDDSGWYDHQVFALETMLLPERGEEHNKLLLTKPYKKRMLEAFQALITKRRETHARQMPPAGGAAAPARQLTEVVPRLRVEPCPSFYIRTARSYAFLNEFLMDSLGEEMLASLHGLRESGERPDNLAAELIKQRDLFYGLYLVSCEDIGHRASLAEGEVSDPDSCYIAAVAWLETISEEPDLAADTRVAIPIYIDPLKQTSRLWVTLGVRLSYLEANFATPPRIRSLNGTGDWEKARKHLLKPVTVLIAVDEFAEVEVPTLSPPNREELRKLCDQHQTKEKIIEALSRGEW